MKQSSRRVSCSTGPAEEDWRAEHRAERARPDEFPTGTVARQVAHFGGRTMDEAPSGGAFASIGEQQQASSAGGPVSPRYGLPRLRSRHTLHGPETAPHSHRSALYSELKSHDAQVASIVVNVYDSNLQTLKAAFDARAGNVKEVRPAVAATTCLLPRSPPPYAG